MMMMTTVMIIFIPRRIGILQLVGESILSSHCFLLILNFFFFIMTVYENSKNSHSRFDVTCMCFNT